MEIVVRVVLAIALLAGFYTAYGFYPEGKDPVGRIGEGLKGFIIGFLVIGMLQVVIVLVGLAIRFIIFGSN